MQPMTQGMIVEPTMHVQVLEVKLTAMTIREAMLEAAVQQLTLESAQHQMEIERLQNIISPPATVDEHDEPLESLSAIADVDVEVEDASADK